MVWFTGGGKGNPFQYFYPKNPMTSMKMQKDMRKVSPPGWKVSNMLLGKSRGQLLITSGNMKRLGQTENGAQLWMCLVQD